MPNGNESDDEFIMPKHSLFKSPTAQASASCNDVTSNGTKYAVTVNIAPTKLINKKQWLKYNPDQQRAVLTRLEATFRKNNPSIVLHRIEFEKCPTVGNIHFHALYEMPDIFLTTLENHWGKFDSTDENTKVPWRHLDIRPCHSVKGWIEYITKTIKTT